MSFFPFLMSLSRDFSMSPFNLFLLLFAQCKTVKQTNESFSSKKQSRIKTMLFNSFRTLHKASRSLTESTLLQKILSFSFIQLKNITQLGIQEGYQTSRFPKTLMVVKLRVTSLCKHICSFIFSLYCSKSQQ